MSDRKIKEIENKEWADSLKWIIEHESAERASEVLDLLHDLAVDHSIITNGKQIVSDYVNSIPAEQEEDYPGDLDLEERIHRAIRWNAMAMVVRANQQNKGIGGHISTYSSAARLFEVGFHHFFRGYEKGKPDIVYFQGHASPGVYARSFLEHRLTEEQLTNFRLETTGSGLPSYPHPRSMPDYWRYPTVSMGLAPIQAIYQARFIKYLENRKLIDGNDQHVWAFLGDGEMDEPESTGALAVASRERLNNLIFVVNCNLQRLDGPVRGNAKVINELEGIFKGAGWTVIKVLWGETWNKLFEKDTSGALKELINTIPDGEMQHWAQYDGKTLRKEVFDKKGSLQKIADHFSDDELDSLTRGGHDPKKIFNAYKQAVENTRGPTVILAQTVKGYRQGDAGEASNVTHQQKVFSPKQLKSFRDELGLELSDDTLEEEVPFIRFEKDSEEFKYLSERRKQLNGWLPDRKNLAKKFSMPDSKIFEAYYKGSAGKEVATTSAFVQLLSKLMKDKQCGKYVVPIIPDESRTFGIDALFSHAGIYSSKGQRYEPVDKGSLLHYNESKQGAIIEEGITEAGSMSTFIAAGTNHTIEDFYTVPFYMFYSMFGFQRIGDLIWAASDARAKGFLMGGISGRTSLAGEGLQHADGQSHVYALAYPTVCAYDPAFAYELAVIVQDGLKRMYQESEDVFYYITISNQAYEMPPLPRNVEEGILKGMYPVGKSRKRKNKSQTVNLLGSGAVMSEVQQAANLLEEEYDIPVNIWSVTSYKALYEDACQTERDNMVNQTSGRNFIQTQLEDNGKVFIATSDYMKALPLTIAKWIPGEYIVLGTDGFGVSDTVPALRNYFEVSAKHIARAALLALISTGELEKEVLTTFDKTYDTNTRKMPDGNNKD